MTAAAHLADIQGLVKTGFGSLHSALYLLLRVAEPAAARAWLRAAPVTPAGARVAEAVQVALTAPGLRALGVPEATIAQFSTEFVNGMASEESRSRRLGDVGANGPAGWRWGAASDADERMPHVLVMLFAENPAALDALERRLGAADGFARGFRVASRLDTQWDMHEPFGFADGLSQPAIDWDERRDVRAIAQEYGNLVAPGEILLGYANEYGKHIDRPLLAADAPGAGELPEAEDRPGLRDLGRNGSYLVYRQLEQDVRGFWRALAERAPSDPIAVAEAMVGRRLEGEPLIEARARIAGIDPAERPRNDFTYDGDSGGLRCPFGAHVRRSNPRTADLPGGKQGLLSRVWRTLNLAPAEFRDDLVASTRYHRILRRGRGYGEFLTPQQALAGEGGDERPRGLHFMCLNANIARQFEFVQNAWVENSKFNGMSGEADPLLGSRTPLADGGATDGFTMPQAAGACRRIDALPRFVTLRGGAYFFLPGLRALRFLAREPG